MRCLPSMSWCRDGMSSVGQSRCVEEWTEPLARRQSRLHGDSSHPSLSETRVDLASVA